MPTAPPKPPPPPTKAPPPPSAIGHKLPDVNFDIESGVKVGAERVVIYGPGGSGKSSLCALLRDVGINPLFLDIGNGSRYLDVDRITSDKLPIWEHLRSALHNNAIWAKYQAVVIDDLTRGQEMAEDWVVRNVKHEKGKPIASIDDYGFGKGLGHVYDAFLHLLGDLDTHARNGRYVICTAHECVTEVPNPADNDYKRYEPRLQSPKKGENSIRHRVKEWCDHLVFIDYDKHVSDDGKASGGGSRTIYCEERPTHWAKSRTLSEPIVYEKGDAKFWKLLLNKE
jgi:hypothetical protein